MNTDLLERIALQVGDTALIIIAIIVNTFVIQYALLSKWKKTRAGESLMYAKMCLAALVDLSLITVILGPDWAGRPYVRAILFIAIAYTQGRLYWSLLRSQARTLKHREVRPMTTKNPLWAKAEAKASQKLLEAEKTRQAELVRANLRPGRRSALSPVPGHSVSTPWGKKPKDNTYWQARGHHTGDDFACDAGTDVVAVLGGVIFHTWDDVLGNIVLLFADDGNTYWYCHLSARSENGSRVEVNDKVGEAGKSGTGAARGPHLHFEKRKGHSRSWRGPDIKPIWY